MIDTRNLAEKREELQTDLVNSFNDYFDTELEDFGDLTSFIDNILCGLHSIKLFG